MRRRWTILGGITLSLALLILATTSDAKPVAQKLVGEYEWSQGGSSGDLQAKFTPTGESSWKVSFHFMFRGQRHIYTGTAEGSLSNGSLAGEVKNENRRRTFSFTGTVSDGAFEGTHAELFDGRASKTGTLTLAAKN